MDKTPEDLIADLRTSCDDFLHSLDGLSEEDVLRRPALGEWSAWEVCYHQATCDMTFIAKLCEILHTDKPSAAKRLMANWARLREETMALAKEIPPDRWGKTGLFSTLPEWTPTTLVRHRAGADRMCMRQVREARGLDDVAPTAVALDRPLHDAADRNERDLGRKKTPDALIADLRASCQEFLDSLDGLSDEDVVRRPAPGAPSTWDLCYILATSEMFFAAKLCEILHPDKPSATQRLMATWSKLRDQAIALAREIPSDRWERQRLFTTIPGDRTPTMLLAVISRHDRDHARQTLEARRSPAMARR